MKIGSPPKGGFSYRRIPERFKEAVGLQLLWEARKFQEGARTRGPKEISVVVTRVSIQGIPKCIEKLMREKCLKSHRRDAPFHVIET